MQLLLYLVREMECKLLSKSGILDQHGQKDALWDDVPHDKFIPWVCSQLPRDPGYLLYPRMAWMKLHQHSIHPEHMSSKTGNAHVGGF